MMRRMAVFLFIITLLSSTGCSMGDALFGLFGSHYSSAYSRDERQADYQSSVERWKDYGVTSDD